MSSSTEDGQLSRQTSADTQAASQISDAPTMDVKFDRGITPTEGVSDERPVLQKLRKSLLSPAQRADAVREIKHTSSKIMGPQTHRLPFKVMWTITLLTAISMALINLVTILSIEYSVSFKFYLMQKYIDTISLGSGIAVLTLISGIYALIGVLLIQCFAPSCGGSGLPENKCYLNGSSVPGFYTKRTLRVRVATVILANAAGYPVGREGPTVVIGSNVAFLLSEWLAQPFVKEWVNFSHIGRTRPAVIVDEERFGHATRISCAVGGACGMAMIFNAPFGGLLYMFEEMTSVSWPLELAFRVFVATMLCAILSYAMLNAIRADIREFVIYAFIPVRTSWQWRDVPLFVVLSAILGVFTSLHTRGMLACTNWRSRMAKKLQKYGPWPKICETLGYNMLCTLAAVIVSLNAHCHEEGQSGLQYVRFNCPEGTYNPIASLLINTSHSSVKLLFSGNNGGEIGKYNAFLAFWCYGLLNIGLTGLPVPGGAFTATMLMGALFGRSMGSLCMELGLLDQTTTGVYAVVGAAAMLCGFKQMTLAVVLIVVECVNNLELGPVVMLGVFVSMLVNWSINDKGHDEAQIESKKLPYLDGEAPKLLDNCFAADLCDPLPEEAILRREATLDVVRQALEIKELQAFPVLEKETDTCIGIITRPHLEAAVRATSGSSGHHRTRSRAFENPFELSDHEQALRVVQGSMPEGKDLMPLYRIMDPTPFTITEEMPVPRLYNLFAKAGERAAVVVGRTGGFRGIITRLGLIKAAREGPPEPSGINVRMTVEAEASPTSLSSRVSPQS